MEVLLKKTKITKSVVNQTLLGDSSLYTDWSEFYDILGWCLISGKRDERWILLYHRTKNTLLRLPYIQKLSEGELVSRNEQQSDNKGGYIYPKVYRLYTYQIDRSRTACISWSEDESKILGEKEKLHEFIKTVNQKGQIFI